jgi:transcriptional regulator with XRE-family HTH domain
MERDLVPGFGPTLRRFRGEKKLTIDELAELSDVDRNSIARIEREERAPSLRRALALAKALGVTVDDLCNAKATPKAAGEVKPKAKSKGGKK